MPDAGPEIPKAIAALLAGKFPVTMTVNLYSLDHLECAPSSPIGPDLQTPTPTALLADQHNLVTHIPPSSRVPSMNLIPQPRQDSPHTNCDSCPPLSGDTPPAGQSEILTPSHPPPPLHLLPPEVRAPQLLLFNVFI